MHSFTNLVSPSPTYSCFFFLPLSNILVRLVQNGSLSGGSPAEAIQLLDNCAGDRKALTLHYCGLRKRKEKN